MKPQSATTQPCFKSLDGSELLEVLMRALTTALRESLLKHDNTFTRPKSFPVAQVQAAIRISLYHDPHPIFSEPYKTVEVPVRFYTVSQPDEHIRGLGLLASEDVKFTFDIGRSIQSAPDAIRENNDLPITQPTKVTEPNGNERVEDVVVEPVKKVRKQGYTGAGERIAAEIAAEKE